MKIHFDSFIYIKWLFKYIYLSFFICIMERKRECSKYKNDYIKWLLILACEKLDIYIDWIGVIGLLIPWKSVYIFKENNSQVRGAPV